MPTKPDPKGAGWLRNFFYRKEVWKTTWKLKLLVLVLAFVAVVLTRPFWSARIVRGLVCVENRAPSDALVLENFDANYLVFERAEELRRAGVASRILVPIIGVADRDMANAYQREFAESMARVARLPAIQTVAVETPQEPISINAVRQVRDLLVKEGIRSVVVVSPAMRSRRSELIYTAVLVPEGISVRCVPAFGTTNTENWLETWHGIQEVLEQYLKLQYYRIFVL